MTFNKQHLYKAITWRIVSIITSLVVSCFFMTSTAEAIQYTIIYSIINTALYYLHDLGYDWYNKHLTNRNK